MTKSRRNQILTDEAVQGELLFRAMLYWFFCLVVVSLFVLAWSFFSGPDRPLAVTVRQSLLASAPAILGSVVLLPLVLIDVLKVSNRFVGPIQQIRCVMSQLASGRSSRRVYLRKDDFWQELANFTNIIADELETARKHESGEEEDDFPYTDDNASDLVARTN